MSSQSFSDLGVPTKLVSALTDNGITSPFPIQTDTLPDTLQGRDVLGRGKTGSGKSLAFCIPMAARLSASGNKTRPSHPRGLILAPTRELATQLTVALEPLARAANLRVTTIFGGVAQNRQVSALKGGVDIVVACPGRLEDLMRQGHVRLDAIEVTVLDEADHMADLGFLPGVTRILNATPSNGQRMLFSATLDNGVDKLVKRFLKNPVKHSVDEANSPVVAMTHHIYDTTNTTAKKDLVELLASGTGRRILFMRTKHQARKLAKQLTQAGIPAVDLHGNLSQNARDRNLAAFSTGNIKVLVATDIAARGVHVDDVQLVVHVDPPAEHKAYLHRSGRTARAGSSGDVVTVVLPEQRRDVAILLRKAGINAQPQQVTAQSAVVTGLVGETAPRVTPAPESASSDADQRRQGGPRGGQRGGGPRGGQRGGGGARSGGQGGQGGRGGSRSGASRSGGAATTVKYSSESQPSSGQRSAQPAGGERRRSTRVAAPARG